MVPKRRWLFFYLSLLALLAACAASSASGWLMATPDADIPSCQLSNGLERRQETNE